MKPAVVYTGVAAILCALLLPASAASAAAPKPLTKAQLKAALLAPKDLSGFKAIKYNSKENSIPGLDHTTTGDCRKAFKALTPLWNGKQGGVHLERGKAGTRSQLKQIEETIVTGDTATISKWEKYAQTVSSSCPGATRDSASGQNLTALEVEPLGDGSYGLHMCWHYDQNGDSTDCDDSGVGIFQDMVIVRVKNALICVVNTGYANYDGMTFDTELTTIAAKKATAKLKAAFAR